MDGIRAMMNTTSKGRPIADAMGISIRKRGGRKARIPIAYSVAREAENKEFRIKVIRKIKAIREA